jgi:ferric iron reductase protein FhuF
MLPPEDGESPTAGTSGKSFLGRRVAVAEIDATPGEAAVPGAVPSPHKEVENVTFHFDSYDDNYDQARQELANGATPQRLRDLAQKYEDTGRRNAANAIRDAADGKPRR